MPATAWMTTFDDHASPRPGTDEVFFDPAKDQSPVRRTITTYHDIWIPVDLVVLFILLVAGVVYFVFRRAARKKRD